MKFAYRNQNNAIATAAYWRRPLAESECYQIVAQSDETAEVFIYDVIGWPFNDANEFIRAFSKITSREILVRINSPGGDVVDACAIYNAIRSHSSTITTRNESLAASAASFILTAGKKRQAYGNTLTMIHNPWMVVVGDPDNLRAAADVGDQVLTNIVDMYADHTNIGKRDLRAMMKAETWMSAKEALANGFIDTIIHGESVKAQFDLSMFANTPNDLWPNKNNGLTVRDAEKALRDEVEIISAAQQTLSIVGGYCK